MIEAAKAFKLECLDNHPSVIILAARSELRLKNIQTHLSEQQIQFVPFCEPDLDNQLTALATEPICSEKRHLFQKYHLVKEPDTPVQLTRYVYQYPDGTYARWFGDCYRGEHKVSDINYADFYDYSSESSKGDGGKFLTVSLKGGVK